MITFGQHNILNTKVSQVLFDAFTESFPQLNITNDEIYSMLAPPPKNNMGDLAFPCFKYAKQVKMSPPELAQTLLKNCQENNLIDEVKNFGPYINFYLNPAQSAKSVLNNILTRDVFSKALVTKSFKTIIEFSQPNTHKELHVGHMRNLCLGDALVKLYRYAGVETLSTTFPGDVGTHVAKCLWYYKKHNKEQVPSERKGAWLGTLYTKGNNLLEEQKGSEQEDINRKELTEILKQLHSESGDYYDLWKETRQWSVDLMQEVYDWADVQFDSWYWESDVDAQSVSLVKKYFEQGLFIEDQGAIGIDLKDDKLGFCLLLKSDGTGLYATKDLELARRKFEDNKVEKSIYVVDNRQALHFKQVFKTLEKMGFENAKNCYHLQYEMVELTDGAMSSRKGNIVALQSLIDQMQNKIKTDYLMKYQDSWSQEEIDETAKIVAAGAIKYGMTKIDSNKKIVFDMNDWLKLDGESGPYIQYVYARIQSILKDVDFDLEAKYETLTTQNEKDLINHLSQFNLVIQNAVEQNKVHLVCQYLYQLAKLFNSFYAECPILKNEDNDQRQARINMAYGVSNTLEVGLGILGIKAPQKM